MIDDFGPTQFNLKILSIYTYHNVISQSNDTFYM